MPADSHCASDGQSSCTSSEVVGWCLGSFNENRLVDGRCNSCWNPRQSRKLTFLGYCTYVRRFLANSDRFAVARELMKRKWLVASLTAIRSPTSAESDVSLGDCCNFWPILGAFVVQEPRSDLETSSLALKTLGIIIRGK